MTELRCREVIRKLSDLLDGDASSTFCDRLRAHLDRCEACAREYDALEDLIALCKRFPDEEIGIDEKRQMKDRLLAVLGGQAPAGSGGRGSRC